MIGKGELKECVISVNQCERECNKGCKGNKILPIIYVKEWECAVLVDTGSTDTIMDETTARSILKGIVNVN